MSWSQTADTRIVDALGFGTTSGPMRQMQVAEPYREAGGTFGSTLDSNYWSTSASGTGASASLSGGVVTVASGTANNGAASLYSVQAPRFVFGHPHHLRMQVRATAVEVAGCTRRWGGFSVSGTAPQDGVYYELSSAGALSAVCVSGGSVSYSREIGRPMDTHQHVYEIIYCDCVAAFLVDTQVVAQIAPTTVPLAQSYEGAIRVQALNSASGTTSGALEVWGGGAVMRMGRPETRPVYRNLTSAATTVLKNRRGRLHRVIVNSTGGTSAAIYDNTAGSGTLIGTVQLNALANLEFGVEFNTGLTVVTTGASPDVTLIWE